MQVHFFIAAAKCALSWLPAPWAIREH